MKQQVIKKIKLVSTDINFGPEPQPDDEVEQRLVIHRNGRVKLTRFIYGSGWAEDLGFPVSAQDTLAIPGDAAATLCDRFAEKLFGRSELDLRATDIGTWHLKVTLTDGQKIVYDGSLFSNPFTTPLSDLTRELLSLPDLLVLDGQRGPVKPSHE